jgi:hypothetical protein
MITLIKILVIFGSLASTGFGIWHFFVPRAWNWYTYINQQATELILAVKAINVFFSLSLVLFGLMNILLILSNKPDRYSIIVVLTATCVLWLTRLVMQILYPQGSINPLLQYGMLTAFILVNSCYLGSLIMTITKKPGA